MDHDRLEFNPQRPGAVRRPAEKHLPGGGPDLRSSLGNAAFTQLVRTAPAVSRNALRSQGAGPLDPEIASAIEARRGAGSPLPEPVRAEMEGHLGVDLAPVRIHTDGTAATLNRAVQAEAFTTGTDVFFAPGRYDPSSASGRGLLAHELTHVRQQARGPGGPGGSVSHPDDPAEVEAAAVGAHVAREAAGALDDEEELPVE